MAIRIGVGCKERLINIQHPAVGAFVARTDDCAHIADIGCRYKVNPVINPNRHTIRHTVDEQPYQPFTVINIGSIA